MIVAMPPVTAWLDEASAESGLASQTQPTLLAMIATADNGSPMLAQWFLQVSAASVGTSSSDPTGAMQPTSNRADDNEAARIQPLAMKSFMAPR